MTEAARFIDDPDTHTLGDDFQVLRPKALAEHGNATILAYYPETTKSGIVLVHKGAGPHHTFVTWRCYWRVTDTGLAQWICSTGNYFEGLDSEHEAWQDFIHRAGINPPATDEEG